MINRFFCEFETEDFSNDFWQPRLGLKFLLASKTPKLKGIIALELGRAECARDQNNWMMWYEWYRYQN